MEGMTWGYFYGPACSSAVNGNQLYGLLGFYDTDGLTKLHAVSGVNVVWARVVVFSVDGGHQDEQAGGEERLHRGTDASQSGDLHALAINNLGGSGIRTRLSSRPRSCRNLWTPWERCVFPQSAHWSRVVSQCAANGNAQTGVIPAPEHS